MTRLFLIVLLLLLPNHNCHHILFYIFDKQIELVEQEIRTLQHSLQMLKELRSHADDTPENFDQTCNRIITLYSTDILPENLKKTHKLSDEDAEKMKSVGDVINYIKTKKGA